MKFFELICDTIIAVTISGILLVGLERVLRLGLIPAIILFIFAFVLCYVKSKKKNTNEDIQTED